jgi:hypothetical protein
MRSSKDYNSVSRLLEDGLVDDGFLTSLRVADVLTTGPSD